MRRSFLLLTCALALTIWGGPVRAQATPAPRPTLARALAALEPPKQDLFLTVGADKIELPPDPPPAEPSDRPGAVGGTYGRLARDFGGVTALAPPTMAVLNTRPGIPDPYDGMPPGDALTLLLAGLNPVQWAAITGENGLGMGDLTDDAQRGQFRAVLPSQDLTVTREYNPRVHVPYFEPVTLAAQDLDTAARLRLGQQVTIDVPLAGPGGGGGTYIIPPLSAGATYDAEPAPSTVPGPIYGAVLRRVLTNTPKDADLDYNAPALKHSLRVDGLLTVGDLVARVGRAVGLELYADRRYETRPVTLVGRRTARAVDLLRATAFCVTGTFRRVGPAYVLTDDLEGTATRRQRLGRFLQEGRLKGEAGLGAAQDSLAAAHGGTDALPWLGGAGFSDAQWALPGLRGMGGHALVTFAQLTPAQQDLVLGLGSVDRNKPFKLYARTHVVLLSPAAPGPVVLGYLSPWFGPSIGSWMRADWQRRRASALKYVPPLNPPPPPPLAHFPAAIPRRALLAAPKTARALDAVIAGMRTSGFNQLWLEVFVGGHPRLDILTEALARTRGTGISVIPTLDLLRWDKDAPAGALDRTVLGETSGEQQAWQRAWSQDYTRASAEMPVKPSPQDSPVEVWANPAAPATEAILLALVRSLAATPGVTTLAVRDTVPFGYIHLAGSGVGGADLGYVPALRLALLRRDHLDPLDLDWATATGGSTDTSLPLFDDPVNIPALGQVEQDWGHLRDGASRDLLRHLLAAAQDTGGRRFRFLVRQRCDLSRYAWYGLWESPQAPLPEVPVTAVGVPSLPWETDYAPVAHSQCRVNLIVSGIGDLNPYAPADALQKLSAGWDGLVLDATAPWEEAWLAYYGWGVKR